MPTGILAGWLAADPVEGIGGFLGCLLGIALTPDLDQVGVSKSEWGLVKWLGPVGFLWMAFWWPYARVIPHRSPWSHLPGLGTLGRILYSIILLSLIWIILGRPALPVIPEWGWALAHGGWRGLLVSDIGHFLLDLFPKKGEKKK